MYIKVLITKFLKIRLLLLIVLSETFLFTYPLMGQKEISLEEAVQIALKNNLNLKAGELSLKAKEKLIGSASFSEKTGFNIELGQINSAFFDNAIGIEQSFSWPSVYRKQKNMLWENAKLQGTQLKLTEKELIRNVELNFLRYQWLTSRINLMQQQDSIFADMLENAIIRNEKGETPALERITIEQKRINLSLRLQLMSKERDWLISELNTLLQSGVICVPRYNNFIPDTSLLGIDIMQTNNNPLLMVAGQELKWMESRYAFTKTALLPDFTVGYKNISFRGIGADEKSYTASDRFHNVVIGINVPLFRKGIKSIIDSEVLEMQAKEQNYQQIRAEQQTMGLNLYSLYSTHLIQLKEFEDVQLTNAEKIRRMAEVQYQNGAINYLEYGLLLDDVFTIKQEYTDRIYKVNEAAVMLRFIYTN